MGVALSSRVPRGKSQSPLCLSPLSCRGMVVLLQCTLNEDEIGKGVRSSSSLMLEAYVGIGLGLTAKGQV